MKSCNSQSNALLQKRVTNDILQIFNQGGKTYAKTAAAQIDQKRIIYVSAEKLSVMYHHYDNIDIPNFLGALIDAHIVREANNTDDSLSSSIATHASVPSTITSTVPKLTHGKKLRSNIYLNI